MVVIVHFQTAASTNEHPEDKNLSLPRCNQNRAALKQHFADHGRGFFSQQYQPGDPQSIIAAAEAMVGLVIEVRVLLRHLRSDSLDGEEGAGLSSMMQLLDVCSLLLNFYYPRARISIHLEKIDAFFFDIRRPAVFSCAHYFKGADI
jgi:hypothetical protein